MVLKRNYKPEKTGFWHPGHENGHKFENNVNSIFMDMDFRKIYIYWKYSYTKTTLALGKRKVSIPITTSKNFLTHSFISEIRQKRLDNFTEAYSFHTLNPQEPDFFFTISYINKKYIYLCIGKLFIFRCRVFKWCSVITN